MVFPKSAVTSASSHSSLPTSFPIGKQPFSQDQLVPLLGWSSICGQICSALRFLTVLDEVPMCSTYNFYSTTRNIRHFTLFLSLEIRRILSWVPIPLSWWQRQLQSLLEGTFLTQGWQSSQGPAIAHVIQEWLSGPWPVTNMVIVQAQEIQQRGASPLSWAHSQGWMSKMPSLVSLGHPRSHSLLRFCHSLQYLQGTGIGAYYPMNLKTFLSAQVLGNVLKSSFSYGSFNVLSLSDATHLPLPSSLVLHIPLWSIDSSKQ